METTDLRTEFTKETKTRFNTEWLAYNDYVAWLEQRLVKLLTIPTVSQQSEQLNCDHEWKCDTFDCYGFPVEKYCEKCGKKEAI